MHPYNVLNKPVEESVDGSVLLNEFNVAMEAYDEAVALETEFQRDALHLEQVLTKNFGPYHHQVSMESIVTGLTDAVKKAWAKIMEVLKKIISWVTGKDKKVDEAELDRVLKAIRDLPVERWEIKDDAKLTARCAHFNLTGNNTHLDDKALKDLNKNVGTNLKEVRTVAGKYNELLKDVVDILEQTDEEKLKAAMLKLKDDVDKLKFKTIEIYGLSIEQPTAKGDDGLRIVVKRTRPISDKVKSFNITTDGMKSMDVSDDIVSTCEDLDMAMANANSLSMAMRKTNPHQSLARLLNMVIGSLVAFKGVRDTVSGSLDSMVNICDVISANTK